jgi:hypothetical protein
MTARHNFIRVPVAILLTACSVNIPEPGHPQARPSDLPSPQSSATIAAAARTDNPQVNAANDAVSQAERHCQFVIDDGSTQARRLSNDAYYRKQAGLLVTTVIGAAGAALTTVLATTQKDASGNANAVPATAVGATTAGATAIAGVIALFVVGPPPDERIKDINAVPPDVAERMAKLDTECGAGAVIADPVGGGTAVPPADQPHIASACKLKADRLKDLCDSKAGHIYPYTLKY